MLCLRSGCVEWILVLFSFEFVDLERNFTDEIVDLSLLLSPLTSTDAAAKRIGALFVIVATRRVRNSEWAVDATAVAHLNLIVGWLTVLVVAPVAEPVRTEAVPKGNIAAVHALPVDGSNAVLLADLLSSASGLQLAILAY